jgi:putative ABC transport system permease protein
MAATGIPMSSKSEGAFQTFSFGTFFKNDSDLACIMSLDMARRVSEDAPGSLVGKTLTLSYAASGTNPAPSTFGGFQIQRIDRECPIVGIVERESGGFPPGGGLGNANLMIPLKVAKAMNDEIVSNVQTFVRDPQQTKSYASIIVKVTQAQSTQDVQDQLRKLGYSVFSVNDALQGAKTAFIILDVILSLIGSIALAVSSLGIVNTMVMSILERTREIGIMKAIGAGNGDIRRIFLIEASIIGLIGGILGIVLGWLVGQIINLGANLYIQSQGGTGGALFSLPLWLVAGAIAFSILVSLLAGSYPASRAARLDPIHALRHD